MRNEGPILERLTHRLSECPPEFLLEPRFGSKGEVVVEAVVSDLMLEWRETPLSLDERSAFGETKSDRANYLRLVLISAWLFHDEWFIERKDIAYLGLQFLRDGITGLTNLVTAELFVTDPDRREELARFALDYLKLRPAGESEEQAADRLVSVSSIKRAGMVKASQEKIKRAEELRKKMAEEAAREAAARYTRE